MHYTKATIHQALSPVKHLFDQDHPMGKIAKTPQEETTLAKVFYWDQQLAMEGARWKNQVWARVQSAADA